MQRRAAVKRVGADYFDAFEIYFFELGVVIKSIFAQILDFAFYFDLFQSRAVVKRVFFYFFDGVGNYYFFDGGVGGRNFVFIPVVHLDFAVGGVKTERVRADIKHAFVLGNFHHSVLYVSFIRHQLVIFDDKGVLHRYAYACHNV